MKKNANRILAYVAGSILLFLYAWVWYRVRLYGETNIEASGYIFGVILQETWGLMTNTVALIGALISSVLVYLGILLKQSIDVRNMDLKKEAENRLKNEAALKALEMIDMDKISKDTKAKNSAVLFTLGSLGLIDLGLQLTSQMIENKNVDVGTVSWMIDKAILTNIDLTQDIAISMFAENILFFVNDNNKLFLPNKLATSYEDLGFANRGQVFTALLEMLISKTYKEWEGNKFSKYKIIGLLCNNWIKEDNAMIKNGIGLCMLVLMELWVELRIEGVDIGQIIVVDIGEDILKYYEKNLIGVKEILKEMKEFKEYYGEIDYTEKIMKIFNESELMTYGAISGCMVKCIYWVNEEKLRREYLDKKIND